MGAPPPKAEQSAAVFRAMEATVRVLHQAGVPIVAGTDQAVPGFSLDREIELYVQAGFTPMEAIQAATLVPARAMGMEKDSGTIEAGQARRRDSGGWQSAGKYQRHSQSKRGVCGGKMYQPAALWSAVGFKP